MPLRGIEPRPNGLKVRHAAITPQRHTSLPSPLSVFELLGHNVFILPIWSARQESNLVAPGSGCAAVRDALDTTPSYLLTRRFRLGACR